MKSLLLMITLMYTFTACDNLYIKKTNSSCNKYSYTKTKLNFETAKYEVVKTCKK